MKTFLKWLKRIIILATICLAFLLGIIANEPDDSEIKTRIVYKNAQHKIPDGKPTTYFLQSVLLTLGYYDYDVNGKYTKPLINSLLTYQKNNKLIETGEADRETLLYMMRDMKEVVEIAFPKF